MNGKKRKVLVSTFATVGIALVVATAAWGISASPSEQMLHVSLELVSGASANSPAAAEKTASAESPSSSTAASSSKAASGKASPSSSSASSASAAPSNSAASAEPDPAEDDQQAEADQGYQETEDEQYEDEYRYEGDDDYYYQAGDNQDAAAPRGGAKAKSRRSNQDSEPSANNQGQSSAQPEQSKVWVEPVYKDVYHDEQGHWETRTREVTKVICGGSDHNPGDPNYGGPYGGPSPVFDDYDGWKAHQDAFLRDMRREDPYYVCTGRHRPAVEITEEETYEEYVIDEEAWTEQVLVSEGHWEYE